MCGLGAKFSHQLVLNNLEFCTVFLHPVSIFQLLFSCEIVFGFKVLLPI
jgi:hypothetical protein